MDRPESTCPFCLRIDSGGHLAASEAVIERSHHPDGYNVGVNIGEAGGQTPRATGNAEG